jgi:hypothetical protein
VNHGSDPKRGEPRQQAELGRLLSAANGYRVVASDGALIGRLHHLRYQQFVDHPDEIVVRRRGLLPRWRALGFSTVEAIQQREKTVVVAIDRPEADQPPSKYNASSTRPEGY